MKKHFLFYAVLLALLNGCASASLVQKSFEPSKGGVVKYKVSPLGGGPSLEKAQNIMAQFCAPSSYKVIQEQASLETIGYTARTTGSVNGNYYNGNTEVTPQNRQFVYVQFRCE